MNIPMEMEVWKGDWGLPSVDLKCLEALAFAKFSGAAITIHKKLNPFWTPSGTFPVFRHGKHCFTNINSVSDYLKKKNFSPDFALNSRQTAEVVACTAMLKEQLYPALQYIWWMDEKNYIGLTRRWYAKTLPIPWNFYYPRSYEKRAKLYFEALFPYVQNNEFIESEVYSSAEKCLTALSTRLGDSDFFFGAHPTSLDATVYAYLAPLIKAPFLSNVLQNHAKACLNLLKFVNRISQRYFKEDLDAYEAKQKELRDKKDKTGDDDSPYSLKNKIIASIFVVFAFTFYAVSNRFISIPDSSLYEDDMSREGEEDEDDEDIRD
ncbi:metaxin-1 [Lycorma delicatula]|uniref:metaxin-1 n=1 Tax=Lycorma delicatula TaxID=130591 RepID=UPI003F511AB7